MTMISNEPQPISCSRFSTAGRLAPLAAEAEFERGHRRQAGVAADHADRRQQQNADQGAEENRQQRTGQAQAWREQCTGLQHHQADAEGEPQGKQIAAAEDTLVGRHRDIGGVSAGLNAQGCYLRGTFVVVSDRLSPARLAPTGDLRTTNPMWERSLLAMAARAGTTDSGQIKLSCTADCLPV